MLVRLGQEVQEVPRGLSAAAHPTRHSPTRRSGSSRSTSATSPASSGCSRIPTSSANTRVPTEPPPGFASYLARPLRRGLARRHAAGFAVLSPEGEFLGFTAIVDLESRPRQGEIGYVVAREARGRGVAGRSLRLVTDWALDTLGLQRVELHIDPENERVDPGRRALRLRPRGRPAVAALQGATSAATRRSTRCSRANPRSLARRTHLDPTWVNSLGEQGPCR